MFEQFGINAGLVEELYTRYLQSPGSVEVAWRNYFASVAGANGQSSRVADAGAIGGRGTISLPEYAPRQSTQAFSSLKTHSSGFGSFFSWQNSCDYRQCTFIKAPFFRPKRRRERMAGTAPDDDPD